MRHIMRPTLRRGTIALSLVSCLLLVMAAPQPSSARANKSGSPRAALDTVLPDLNFTGVTFADALDYIRDVSGANMHINWPAIEATGIGKDTQINVHIRHVSTRKALSLVLAEAGSEVGLAYYFDDGVLEITTREIADKSLITRIYPVDDLIMEVPDFTDAPDFNLNTSGGGSGGGGGGGGSGIFGGGGGGGGGGNDQGGTRLERAQKLIDMIVSVIQPEKWELNGGNATIRFFNGSLIVSAPRSIHEALAGDFE